MPKAFPAPSQGAKIGRAPWRHRANVPGAWQIPAKNLIGWLLEALSAQMRLGHKLNKHVFWIKTFFHQQTLTKWIFIQLNFHLWENLAVGTFLLSRNLCWWYVRQHVTKISHVRFTVSYISSKTCHVINCTHKWMSYKVSSVHKRLNLFGKSFSDAQNILKKSLEKLVNLAYTTFISIYLGHLWPEDMGLSYLWQEQKIQIQLR